MTNRTGLMAIALLGLLSWGQAFASYTFTYTGTYGADTYVLSGTLITATNGPGPLQVTGGSAVGSGTANSGVVYTLLTGGTPGSVFSSPSGAFNVDNLLLTGSDPLLDVYGLLFATGDGHEVNIWGDPSHTPPYTYMKWTGGAYLPDGSTGALGTFSVEPVPLPAAAWLLGSGLLGLAGLGRRKKS